MGRPKKATKTLGSINECDAAMYRLLMATIERKKLESMRDLQVAAAQRLYEADINAAVRDAADLEAQLQQYYLTHLAEVERDGKKSLQLTYGVMGRRLSPPAVHLASKSWTWAAVLAKLREAFGDRFIRMRDPEVDKEKVKEILPADQMAAYGMKLHQDENFYAEPSMPATREAV